MDALIVTIAFLGALCAAGLSFRLALVALRDLALVVLPAYLVANALFGLYRRIWRYAGIPEMGAIAGSTAVATVITLLFALTWLRSSLYGVGTILLGGFLSLTGFVAVRYRAQILPRAARDWFRGGGRAESLVRHRRRVLIVGAGEAGQILALRLQGDKYAESYEVVGFIDDDPAKQGMIIHGAAVLGDRQAIPEIVPHREIEMVVIAIYNISGDDISAILDLCVQTTAAVKVLPEILDFLQEKGGLAPVRDIAMEDLLGRKPVEIDRTACRDLIAGRKVLVTGAAGSIGSELCRQILRFEPGELLALDNNESGLYDLDIEMRNRFPQAAVRYLIADVTRQVALERVFAEARPEIVFHAAAYKHVPLMELFPDEAVRVNVLGTRTVVDLAVRYGAHRFVFISTDKAVNPSSIMGATKRLGEMLILASNAALSGDAADPSAAGPQEQPPDHPWFTAVRFGNVLGSRGSVVPTFQRQIDMGGPVTVTHRDITRYFMSIAEAGSLVIQTAALTRGGGIFMLDMGQQIRIDDLARRLIRLRGLRPDVDIPIVYVGVRPGDKMREELASDVEQVLPTSSPSILRIEPQQPPLRSWLDEQLRLLGALAAEGQKEKLVELLYRIVQPNNPSLAQGGGPK